MSLINKDARRKLVRMISGPPLVWLIYLVIKALRTTMRIEVRGGGVMADFVDRGEGFVGAFWHGRLLMIPPLYPGQRMHVLIGTHRDGQLIADVMTRFGFGHVRGSSSKGGREALREMVRLLTDNNDVAITPDGPRGPAEVAKLGVAQVAKLAGRAVIPIAFAASPAWRLSSWDRFIVPKPFSRGAYVVGEPLRLGAGENVEDFRLRIEEALRRVTAEAEAACGAKAAPRPLASGDKKQGGTNPEQ